MGDVLCLESIGAAEDIRCEGRISANVEIGGGAGPDAECGAFLCCCRPSLSLSLSRSRSLSPLCFGGSECAGDAWEIRCEGRISANVEPPPPLLPCEGLVGDEAAWCWDLVGGVAGRAGKSKCDSSTGLANGLLLWKEDEGGM